MSPAKSKKAAGKPRKAAAKGKAKPKAVRAKPKGKASKPAARAVAKPAAPTHGGNVHGHCAAADPFGDPCQNLPRRPSKYCVIHSYLER